VNTSTAVTALACLVGLIIGSFLTVVTARVPEGKSIVAPSSRCPKCSTPIRAIDNIPVFSFVVRRGRCRACGEPISLRYPALELTTAVLFGAVADRAPDRWAIPALCALVAGLIALTVIDLDHQRLPTPIVFVTGATSGALLVIASIELHDSAALVHGVIAGAVAFAVFAGIFYAVPHGMGFGDVRLAGLCGAVLGWIGYRITAVGFMMSFVTAGIFGVALLALGRAGRKTRVPFGPFLALGTVIAILVGAPIARVWLG
jgi:leader peptidase (prepilin peptidase)/N-methyltransferase